MKQEIVEEIKQDELISKKPKKVCKILNYTKHLLILASSVTRCVSVSTLASMVTRCVSISTFASLVSIPAVIAIILKICALIAGIKEY